MKTKEEYKQKLDQIHDIIWDEALPCIFDVEHTIACYSYTLPIILRRLEVAIRKIEALANPNPDIG